MAFFDGTFSSPSQDGAPALGLPLQRELEFFASETTRRFVQAPSSLFTPQLNVRTFFWNYLTYSDDLTNAAWTKLSTDTIGTGNTDPEGNATLCKVKESTNNGAHGVSQSPAVNSGGLCFGVIVAPAERTIVRLRLNNATDGDLAKAVFDLSAGTVVSGTGAITQMANGFFWCSVSGTATVTNSVAYVEIGQNSSTFSYAGTSGDGLYAWHATLLQQLAVGPAVLTTSATRGVTCPLIDSTDPISYLCEESVPEEDALKLGVARWMRKYARVPRETNVPSSIIVVKPDIPTTGANLNGYVANTNLQYLVGPCYFLQTGALAFKRNINIPVWELYRCVRATGDTGPIISNNVTGGTYTLTFGGATTASINWNDTAATVQTRLNALANITALGGCTVTGSYTTGFTVTLATLTNATVDTSSLTNSAGTISATIYGSYNGYYQTVSIGPNLTGGTYKITILAQQTAAINYNASLSSIASAINALANVTSAGGVTVTGAGLSGGTINIVIQFNYAAITGQANSLAPTGSSIAASLSNAAGSVQVVNLYGANSRIVSVPNHGFLANDTLVIAATANANSQTPTNAYFDITSFTILDANTISLQTTGANLWSTITTINYLGALRIQNYQPAPINVRCQRITDFYLPGVSPGILTALDIPMPAAQSDPAQFLYGMVSATTLNYEVGDMQVYQGPILQIAKKVVTVADLNVTTVNL